MTAREPTTAMKVEKAAGDGGGEAQGAAPNEDEVPPKTPLDAVRANGKAFDDATEKLRKRNDIGARALLSILGSAISALGVVKFVDVFPYPSEFVSPLWAILLAVGFIAALTGVVGLAIRFFRVQQPLVMMSDIPTMKLLDGLSSDDVRIIRNIYRANAELNGVPELAAYEARGHRFKSVAAETVDADEKKALLEQAELIGAEVETVFKRAKQATVLGRTYRAATQFWTPILLAMIAAGLIAASLAYDRIDSAKTEFSEASAESQLAFYDKCVATAGAGVSSADLEKIVKHIGGGEADLSCPAVAPPAETSSDLGGVAASWVTVSPQVRVAVRRVFPTTPTDNSTGGTSQGNG